MTVTVLGGTPVATLEAALAEHGQECPLDPRSTDATVGGVLACGLSGPRRLRYGPLRDRILEVRFLTGDGRIVKGGGPTVKNVTGYDLPRLFVGSLGTLGVITQVTLRTQPRAECSQWAQTEAAPDALRDLLFRPATLAWDGRRTFVRLEGYAEDVAAEQRHANLVPLARTAELARGRAPGPDLDRTGGAGGARPRSSNARIASGWPKEGWARCTSRRRPRTVLPPRASRRRRPAGGCCAKRVRPDSTRSAARPATSPSWPASRRASIPTGKLNPGRLPFLRRAA